MQLGGGCASGTLYTAGGGNTRMVVVLAAFVAGSFLATQHFPWWLGQPSLNEGNAISLVRELGLWPALVLQLAVLGGIAALTCRPGAPPARPAGGVRKPPAGRGLARLLPAGRGRSSGAPSRLPC